MPEGNYSFKVNFSANIYPDDDTKDYLKGLKILPDRDYKSINCLRDHSHNKKQPTRDIAQCFVIEDAQIIN